MKLTGKPKRPLLLDVVRQYENDILAKPNVIGYSLIAQHRIKKGKVFEELVLRVYVKRKLPEHALKPEHMIPRRIGSMPTDVVEIGEIKPYSAQASDRTKRIRPLVAGISIGHYQITAGTLGWFGLKGGNVYLLSNAHVFTPDPFQPSGSFDGDPIYQPGPIDGGGSTDTVAHYYEHVQLYPRESGRANHVDFASATPIVDFEVRNFIGVEPSIIIGLLFAGSSTTTIVSKCKYIEDLGYSFLAFDGSSLPCLDPLTDNITNTSVKDGRTSGFKGNVIIDESGVVLVQYSSDKVAKFEDVIVYYTMGAPGDSGSLVFLPSLIYNT